MKSLSLLPGAFRRDLIYQLFLVSVSDAVADFDSAEWEWIGVDDSRFIEAGTKPGQRPAPGEPAFQSNHDDLVSAEK
jgi:hypothetical protein